MLISTESMWKFTTKYICRSLKHNFHKRCEVHITNSLNRNLIYQATHQCFGSHHIIGIYNGKVNVLIIFTKLPTLLSSKRRTSLAFS